MQGSIGNFDFTGLFVQKRYLTLDFLVCTVQTLIAFAEFGSSHFYFVFQFLCTVLNDANTRFISKKSSKNNRQHSTEPKPPSRAGW